MRVGLVAIICLTIASSAVAQPKVTPPCDRACLEGYVDRYLDAMLANEVNPKLFARDVKFTENVVRLPLGNEGLWFGMSGRGKYRFYVPDVETQQVAFIGTVIENARNRGANDGQGDVVAIGLRLKVVGGFVTEVEQLAIRPETPLARGGGAGGRGAGAAPAAWRGAPPAGSAVAPPTPATPGTGVRVEAMGHRAPYGIPSGWSSFEQAMSESIQSVR